MNTADHERDDLWDLLGKAKTTAPSPFFARNVVREVRQLPARPNFVEWLQRWWKAPVLAGSLAALAVALTCGALWPSAPRASAPLTISEEQLEEGQLLAVAEQVYESPDFQVIGQLDELLETEENSVWLSSDIN